MTEEENDLIVHALSIAISRKKLDIRRKQRMLFKANDMYEQSVICKSIEILNDKIVKFEKLKRKIRN